DGVSLARPGWPLDGDTSVAGQTSSHLLLLRVRRQRHHQPLADGPPGPVDVEVVEFTRRIGHDGGERSGYPDCLVGQGVSQAGEEALIERRAAPDEEHPGGRDTRRGRRCRRPVRVAEGTVEAERVEELLIEMAGQRIERADRLGPEPVPDVDQQVEAADTDALEDVDFEM